jgi:hypothetical protein
VEKRQNADSFLCFAILWFDLPLSAMLDQDTSQVKYGGIVDAVVL